MGERSWCKQKKVKCAKVVGQMLARLLIRGWAEADSASFYPNMVREAELDDIMSLRHAHSN